MRSDYATSSMPGFMTPSTMDSRQKIISRLSLDYPVDINKSSVSRLSNEIQQLMRRKVMLMEEMYDIEKLHIQGNNTSKLTESEKLINSKIEIAPATTASVGNIHSKNIKQNLSTSDDLMTNSK